MEVDSSHGLILVEVILPIDEEHHFHCQYLEALLYMFSQPITLNNQQNDGKT
jgi:hypothetical protein